MTLSQKIGYLKEISSKANFKVFSFNHGPENYVADFSEKNTKIFLEKEHLSVKRKIEKIAKYNKLQAEKILWVDEDENELGYGEKGRLKSIEITKNKIK